VLQLASSQLQEIEMLREAMKSLEAQNNFLQKELETQRNACLQLRQLPKNLSADQENKFKTFMQAFEAEESKTKQILDLKRLIFKYLVEKSGKC
jgi:hypothetical protein